MSDSPRRLHGLPFIIVFFIGFGVLAFRGLNGPNGSAWETGGPLIGGALMGLFVAWIVARERKDRAEAKEKDAPPN